jgi:hypothetical protein
MDKSGAFRREPLADPPSSNYKNSYLFSLLLLAAVLLGAAPTVLTAQAATVICSSQAGERMRFPADTSRGVAIASSTGEAPSLPGETRGIDDQGIGVSDRYSGDSVVGQEAPKAGEETEAKKKSLEHIPGRGFRLFEGQDGEVYFRLFTYARYLNQMGLDSTYTDYFGTTKSVQQRQDAQLNKFTAYFSGWFLTPQFRYFLWIWSANPSQGDPAQVVAGGTVSWVFNRFITLGAGIASLPTTRSTEGQFPNWLTVDNRLTADEFFRGSYTTGFFLKGEVTPGVKYTAMIGNNLSQLGVSASQLASGLNTQSFALNWMPTTGEFGFNETFGDYDYHQKVATRLGAHYTHSREDKQSQPGTNTIENSQVRLSDGSIVFTPDLFGPGITVDKVNYDMTSVDAGGKYKGLALEAEYYWRWLSNFTGTNTGGIADIDDHGFQVQSSAMVVPKALQAYLSGSAIRGRYGNASEVRAGLNWYFVKERGLRVNAEWLHLNKCPVGYAAVPYPVGGNGNVFHTNIELNF